MTHRDLIPRPASLRTGLQLAVGALLLTLLTPWGANPAAAAYGDAPGPEAGMPEGFEGSYSYVRVLEGSATLIQGDTGDRDQVEVNQPILVGDRLWVAPRGRVEVVLSDRNLLRIDSGSEVIFDALAGSPDRNDPATILRVPQGNVQLVVVSDFLGRGLPRVDTPNATAYARDYGKFRITTDAGDWTELVTREGSAEVVTRSGSLVAEPGQAVVVEGERGPSERVRRAGRLDSLETWGERLDREARYAAVPYVDDSIRYEAATLDRHGSWVTLEGRYAWRPRVASDWRPYRNGRWSHSPLGYTWISSEPWGWVPYHYGTWDYVAGTGWAWFPGSHFAPAWVYWYWTDAYVGWVPVGYYTHHYRSSLGVGFGFRSGVYGWAGGHWNHYRRWNFCELRYFGSRRQHHYVHPGHRFADHVGHAEPRRGILTTDTRAVPRLSAGHSTERGAQIVRALADRGRPGKGDLPDVTAFVARKRTIGQEIRGRIAVDRTSGRGGERALLVDEMPRGTSRGDRNGRGIVDRADALDRSDRRGAITDPRGGRGAADRSGSIESFRRNLPKVRPRSDGAANTDRSGAFDRTRRIDPESRRPSVAPRGPDAGTRSWRDKAPARRPERPSSREVERGVGQRGERGQAARSPRVDRTRRDRVDDRSRRTPVSRRVIEGVRSNSRSSGRPATVDRNSSDHRDRSRATRERTRPPRTRARSSSPPPNRSSSTSSRSRSSDRRNSVAPRSSSPRSRSSSAAPSRSRSSDRSSSAVRSSSSRSRGSASARSSSGRSSRSSSSSRSRAKEPPL